MRLEDYWGVGPKTSERLREQLGLERAVEAIESAEIRALTDAGIPRGRATRILRRANGEGGMEVFGTGDARDVYDQLLDIAAEYAVTEHAADRIRVLTPLPDRDAIEDRLDDVLAARDAWESLDDDERERVIDAFTTYDQAGGTARAAVEAALTLREAGLRGGTFEALDEVDDDDLRAAAEALRYVDLPGGRLAAADASREPDGTEIDPTERDRPSAGERAGPSAAEVDVAEGADERLDRLRGRLADARDLENSAFDVLESIQGQGVRNLEDFEHAFVEYIAEETDLTRDAVRGAAAEDAVDATDFVSTSLRQLVADLESQVAEREEAVATDLLADIDAARGDIDAAVAAVDDIAFMLSLARFATAHDLIRPTLVEDGLAVGGARNLFLGGDVQPITYGIGTHSFANTGAVAPNPPSGDRVAVLTGANSGGKTTLLETLCSVALLTAMGLPVPAERAEVGRFDTIVFHRRHASFNAGVLESTLKSIVPPLTREGRTLMLVDEFEAITEPGRAADLLNGLVDLTVDREALGVYVTHLADDLSPLPIAARTDGIFAEGLTQELELQVDYQPRFATVGKSTPEFIVSRLVANARDRAERQGFEELASAVGEEAVQRTLSDARWQE